MRFVSGVKNWNDSSVTAKIIKTRPPWSLSIPSLIQLFTGCTKLHNIRVPLGLYLYVTAIFGHSTSPEHRLLHRQTPFPASDAQRDIRINWKLQDILCQLPQWFNLILIWALFSAGSISTSDLCLRFTCKYWQIWHPGGCLVLCASLSQKIDRWRIDKKPNVTKTAFDSFP